MERVYVGGLQVTSHSQHGEDLFIHSMFPAAFKGTIFEVGAAGPVDLSNSRLFIEAGWKAILVEPSPAPLRALIGEYAYRSEVTIYAGAVGPANEFTVSRFDISDGPLSTNVPDAKDFWEHAGEFIGSMMVPVYPASFFSHVVTDVLSVDTEGNSFEVAIALLGKLCVRPKVLCVEREENDHETIRKLCDMFQYSVVPHEPSGGVNKIFRHKEFR